MDYCVDAPIKNDVRARHVHNGIVQADTIEKKEQCGQQREKRE